MSRALTERRCLQYRLTGTETLGRGPLVFDVVFTWIHPRSRAEE